ncbi:MAG TPA: fibrobacter succinogenes major paralogous domain-containing protein [bacterium]|nr:fibrobacter succinogenes major paralogous domain-containing protein [bacterium]HPG47359.1 fibrobacter succinogenes major paralogous domain-containing protein [bacterium]HPM96711.1 fibrobacter succinogenes major paralogous domain-containing protein [bacterium]
MKKYRFFLLLLFVFGLCCSNCGREMKDIDGNRYRTVKIGEQWWMAENLKVTHYRNGEAIANITENDAWGNPETGAYCSYDNNDGNVPTYGRLYNWYAVNDLRGLAPEGWHVPSDEEWKQLEMYLGMSQSEADDIGWRGTNEGGKLKETTTTHWQNPNTGATNESGFSALPGGCRNDVGVFHNIGKYTLYWSSLESHANRAWHRDLGFSRSEVVRFYDHKLYGFSVRCVKD